MKAHIERFGSQVCSIVFALWALSAAGCSDYSSQNDALRAQLLQNEKQTADLQKSVTELTNSGQECRRQVLTLQGLSAEQKKAGVPEVLDVIIQDRTGIYAAETPAREPRLIVYFKPIDDVGDAVKAPGAVHVELWDLGQAPAEAMLGSWDVSAGELKKTWSGSLLSNFYRLVFPLKQSYSDSANLTVKLTFTDYFTGRSFSPQQAVKSR